MADTSHPKPLLTPDQQRRADDFNRAILELGEAAVLVPPPQPNDWQSLYEELRDAVLTFAGDGCPTHTEVCAMAEEQAVTASNWESPETPEARVKAEHTRAVLRAAVKGFDAGQRSAAVSPLVPAPEHEDLKAVSESRSPDGDGPVCLGTRNVNAQHPHPSIGRTTVAGGNLQNKSGHSAGSEPADSLPLVPAPPEPQDIELATVQSACDHWFTQGGEAQFGPLSACLNADELIASILHVVRAASARSPTPDPQNPGLSLSIQNDPLAISALLDDGNRERERLWRGLYDIVQALKDVIGQDAVMCSTERLPDLIRTLKVSPTPDPQAWQPIETAPKDGTWILLCVEGSDKAHIGTWNAGSEATDGWEGYAACWEKDGEGLQLHDMTHWKPLPAPPADREETP